MGGTTRCYGTRVIPLRCLDSVRRPTTTPCQGGSMIWKDWSGMVPCVLVVLVLLQSPGPAHAQDDEIRCNYNRKFECAQSGCLEAPTGAEYLLLPPLSALITHV